MVSKQKRRKVSFHFQNQLISKHYSFLLQTSARSIAFHPVPVLLIMKAQQVEANTHSELDSRENLSKDLSHIPLQHQEQSQRGKECHSEKERERKGYKVTCSFHLLSISNSRYQRFALHSLAAAAAANGHIAALVRFWLSSVQVVLRKCALDWGWKWNINRVARNNNFI